jgi:hypothetical protein
MMLRSRTRPRALPWPELVRLDSRAYAQDRDMLELLIVTGRALALGSEDIANWFWRT